MAGCLCACDRLVPSISNVCEFSMNCNAEGMVTLQMFTWRSSQRDYTGIFNVAIMFTDQHSFMKAQLNKKNHQNKEVIELHGMQNMHHQVKMFIKC